MLKLKLKLKTNEKLKRKQDKFEPKRSPATGQQFLLLALTVGQRDHHREHLRSEYFSHRLRESSNLVVASKEGNGALKHCDPGLSANSRHLMHLLVFSAESIYGHLKKLPYFVAESDLPEGLSPYRCH